MGEDTTCHITSKRHNCIAICEQSEKKTCFSPDKITEHMTSEKKTKSKQ